MKRKKGGWVGGEGGDRGAGGERKEEGVRREKKKRETEKKKKMPLNALDKILGLKSMELVSSSLAFSFLFLLLKFFLEGGLFCSLLVVVGWLAAFCRGARLGGSVFGFAFPGEEFQKY